MMKFQRPRTVVLLGEAGVGKSTLAAAIGNGEHLDSPTPDIAAVYRVHLVIENTPVVLRVVDLPEGAKETDEVLAESSGFILLYAVNDLASFRAVPYHRNRAIRAHRGDDKLAMILLGCKVDAGQRQVATSQGRELAQRMGTQFREISARDITTCDAALLVLTRAITESYSGIEITHEVVSVASALHQIRQAYNVFKKDKHMNMTVKDCMTIFHEISNPFNEEKFQQTLARMTGSASRNKAAWRIPHGAMHGPTEGSQTRGENFHSSDPRVRSRSEISDKASGSAANSPDVDKHVFRISFTVFLQLFYMWVRDNQMSVSARIHKTSTKPGKLDQPGSFGFVSRSANTPTSKDVGAALLDKETMIEAFGYVGKMFYFFDTNKDGIIDQSELRAALALLTGGDPAEADVQTLLAELDVDKNGVISFDEFLFVFFLLAVEGHDKHANEEEGEQAATMHSPAVELRLAVRSGVLYKRGSFLKIWRKKWCVLKGVEFFVYSGPNSSVPEDVINIQKDCYIDDDTRTGVLSMNSSGQFHDFRSVEPSEVGAWARDIRANLVSHGR